MKLLSHVQLFATPCTVAFYAPPWISQARVLEWVAIPRTSSSFIITIFFLSQVTLLVKNLPANAGDVRDGGSIPGLGRSPVEEGTTTRSSVLARRIG